MSGGMYNILKVIYEKRLDNFKSHDLNDILDISECAIRNNLKRLVKIGILQRQEIRMKNGGGKMVTYTINKELMEYLYRTLYN